MQKSSRIALTLAALLVVVLAAYFVVRQPQPSDQEQIMAQMDAARAAAERHDAGGIMKIISADYKGGTPADGNVDELHFFLSRNIGKAGPVDVTLAPPSITLQGDAATSVSHLTVRTRDDNMARYDQNITLHWKRESGYRLLVVPTAVWRVVKADFPYPEE